MTQQEPIDSPSGITHRLIRSLVQAMRIMALFALTGIGTPASAEPMLFIHPPPENKNDQRHAYYWELLDAALKTNRDKYGDYKILSHEIPMNYQRGIAEVAQGTGGRVNIIVRATSPELETSMRAIPLPLDKGLLGYRLFLVTPDTQAKLASVKSLADLQRFSVGQVAPWADVKILTHNHFQVVTTDSYESLFKMLGAKRFDLLSRGVNEIYTEWVSHRDQTPDIKIEKHLILAYPLPRYFFVPRNAEGERMAERIEDGLRRLAKSGEFNRHYRAYKKLVLAHLDLHGRKIVRIDNPLLSDKAPPLTDKAWWDDLDKELTAARDQRLPNTNKSK